MHFCFLPLLPHTVFTAFWHKNNFNINNSNHHCFHCMLLASQLSGYRLYWRHRRIYCPRFSGGRSVGSLPFYLLFCIAEFRFGFHSLPEKLAIAPVLAGSRIRLSDRLSVFKIRMWTSRSLQLLAIGFIGNKLSSLHTAIWEQIHLGQS